jgi:(S)-ureidoglycine aminohydrolase
VTDPHLTVASSRGRRGASYHLLTPPNRYPSRLAGFAATTVFKLATPRTGSARFGQYLLQLAPGGGTTTPAGAADFEHFFFALDGQALLDDEPLTAGGYAYLPAGSALTLRNADAPATLLWLKRRYEAAAGLPAPAALRGHRDEVETITTPSGLVRRELLPADDPAFDFNMSLLAFPPGASLGAVEVHDEEHGLYMTAGGGIYHLDGDDLEVMAGDFIYMAPYCPQYFTPTGPDTAEYLLYKDVFRDGF